MSEQIGISFADIYKIDETWLAKNKIFNPTLDVDAPLFIDPFLLPGSAHPEFSDCAFRLYEEHFGEIHRFLTVSERVGDKLWQAAQLKFEFGESHGMSGTCLGYSKRSTKGHGFGPILSARALSWAADVIHLGVKDPELFSCMSLFEKGIGADLISDMITNIALPCILKFNDRVYSLIEKDLGIKISKSEITLAGKKAVLPLNPQSNDGSPIILLASDVLKHLPTMDNARNLAALASENAELRERVNKNISAIFKIRTKADKEATKKSAMESAAAFQTLLDLLKILEKQPYDVYKDPDGLLQWRPIAKSVVAAYKLEIKPEKSLSRIDRVDFVARAIIEKFRSLVEENRLSRVFHVEGRPRHERFAQLLFYSIASSYCDANDLDISPESDAGAGPVDFKYSSGTDKVVTEIKLSTNSKVVDGYEKQLKAYNAAEGAKYGHYVVVDVGKLGFKWKRLLEIAKNNPEFAKKNRIYLIDGHLKDSASKL